MVTASPLRLRHFHTFLCSKNEAENLVYNRDFSDQTSPVITHFSALEFWTFCQNREPLCIALHYMIQPKM